MSLVGFLPPLCDDGKLLVDGGYVNNLPADVMRMLGARTVIAVDVGSEVDTSITNYGDSLSGWWLLWKRWNPFTSKVKIPNLSDIQTQLAYISCDRQLAEVKREKYCRYMRPPVNHFATLEFGRFDEIFQAGYTYAQQQIDLWKEESLTITASALTHVDDETLQREFEKQLSVIESSASPPQKLNDPLSYSAFASTQSSSASSPAPEMRNSSNWEDPSEGLNSGLIPLPSGEYSPILSASTSAVPRDDPVSSHSDVNESQDLASSQPSAKRRRRVASMTHRRKSSM